MKNLFINIYQKLVFQRNRKGANFVGEGLPVGRTAIVIPHGEFVIPHGEFVIPHLMRDPEIVIMFLDPCWSLPSNALVGGRDDKMKNATFFLENGFRIKCGMTWEDGSWIKPLQDDRR